MISGLTLPTSVESPSGLVRLRRAQPADAPAIMAFLASNAISASRGDQARAEDEPLYTEALRAILASQSNDLIVATFENASEVIGTFQLTLIPGMARRGSSRLLVEAVHVADALRSRGIGTAMMRWVMDTAAPELRAMLIQLTSDARRGDAHRFYRKLGFADSHIGFKYHVAD